MSDNAQVSPKVADFSVEARLKQLEEENARLKRLEAGEVFNQLQSPNTNHIVKEMVEKTLGKRFVWRVTGFGKYQSLELQLPEDLADPVTSYEHNLILKNDPKTGEEIKIDGRARFRKPHPLAGQVQGDVRTCRIQDEDQLQRWLELVKENIANRFKLEKRNLPSFN